MISPGGVFTLSCLYPLRVARADHPLEWPFGAPGGRAYQSIALAVQAVALRKVTPSLGAQRVMKT